MKVVVTGGAGFIGSHVVDALVTRGHHVTVIDSLDPEIYRAPPAYLNPGAEYCITDLRHLRADSRFDGTEAIVHLAALGGVARAARQRENVLGGNCVGTARLLELASGWSNLQHTVLCSSFSIYGSNYLYRCTSCDKLRDGTRRKEDLEAGRFDVLCECGKEATIVPIKEDARPDPLEAYGASKYMQELCFRGFDRGRFTTLRFSSVYGTRLRLDDGEATIIAKIAGWIREGISPRLFEDGRQIRDWVHVRDIVDVITRLVDGQDAAPVINVCTGSPATLVEACESIAKAMNKDVKAEVVGGYRAGDMRHCLGDTTNVRRLLGRTPMPFQEGAALAFGTGEKL
jgi:dTDP-L-rhamnose 4-epimerase